MFFYTFLPKILNMSLTASVAILFVLLLRLLLKKAPKVISYALWGVVLFRLLCPVSIESGLSLFGLLDTPTVGTSERTSTVEYIPSNIVHTEFPEVVLPVPGIGEAITEALPQGEEQLVADPLEAPMVIATYVWVGGILVTAIYGFMTYVRLRRALVTASPLRDNIYLADDISSPFVMGLFRPKIYLPSEMEEQEQTYIILHEQHHIRRLDHIAKALAFVALCIHWFNPLVWVAFILSGKDMEMSCDEAVVRKLGLEIRADYSASLLSLATGKRIIAGMPLAFGEGNTKSRIKNLANWKKPAFWVVLAAVIACAALAVCLLTNPKAYPEKIQVNNHLYLRQEPNAETLPKGSYELGFLDRILHRTKGHPPGDFSAVNLDAKYAGNMLYQSGEEADVIYLEDLRGFYIPFKTELEDGDSPQAPVPSVEADKPVTWTYSPAMNASWHAAFYFTFDMEYSHIEASCDHGTLWDLSAEGQPMEQSLRFETGSPVCWTPSEGETLTYTAERAVVHFTVYDGGEILYTGDLEISRIGTEEIRASYQACLTGDDLLTLQQAPANAGGIVALSGSAAMVSGSDLNHNHTNELVFVREKIPGELHELVVRENGEVIWTMEAGLPHVGWNTIMLYSEDGKDYLVQYQPSMYQGMGSYTCTVFSLEGGGQTVKRKLSVDFEVQPGDPVSVEETPEMKQFAQSVNLLMRNSTVLLSTEQGILVDEYTQATTLPQLYPVRFNPDEIQAAIDGGEGGEPLTPNAVRFPEAPVELLFASGAGAWGTVLTLNPDGSFTGSYSDAEMGDNAPEYPHGTYYVCDFEGRFTDIQQNSDYAFSMHLESLTASRQEGETWIEDQIRYIASEPYGINDAKDFLLYAPGTPADDLPADCRDWWPDAWLWRSGEVEALDGWALCNVDEGLGFYERHSSVETVTP